MGNAVEKIERKLQEFKEEISSDYGGVPDRYLNLLASYRELLEAVDSAEFNMEIDEDCDCCLNNDPLRMQLREALEAAARHLGE